MSVAIYTKNIKQSKKWLDVLHRELPNHKIEIYQEISNFDTVELLICWKPYEGLIKKFSNLKAIQSLGAGVDHVFDHNTIPKSIQVSKIVDHQLTHDMWEHVLSVVLSDMKNLPMYRELEHTQKWKPKKYKRIEEVTIGILGLGTIGSYAAKQFRQLGFEVIGWSKSQKALKKITTFEGREGLYSVCSNSDYLINILPLTQLTEGILNKDLFARMKPSSFIINVGRGPHVVDQDLIESIDSEMIRGASLDVFHTEPLPESHKFWSHPQINITPHIASLTNIDTVFPQIIENIKRLDLGKTMLNLVDNEKGY